jgi:hypothetical protein
MWRFGLGIVCHLDIICGRMCHYAVETAAYVHAAFIFNRAKSSQ